MPHLQTFGDIADAHAWIRLVAPHHQQQKMLLGRDPFLPGLQLGKAHEASNGIPKVRLVAIIALAEL